VFSNFKSNLIQSALTLHDAVLLREVLLGSSCCCFQRAVAEPFVPSDLCSMFTPRICSNGNTSILISIQQTCAGNLLNNSECSSVDIACLCQSSTSISALGCCLPTSCGAADQTTAIAYLQQLCATAGVTLPSSLTCDSSSSSDTAIPPVQSSSSSDIESSTIATIPVTKQSSSIATSQESTSELASSTSSSNPASPSSSISSIRTTSSSVSPTTTSSELPAGGESSPSSSANSTSHHHGDLSAGAIAGIAIGAIAILAIICFLVFFLLRRRRQSLHETPHDSTQSYPELETNANRHEAGRGSVFNGNTGHAYEKDAKENSYPVTSPTTDKELPLTYASPTSREHHELPYSPSARIVNVAEADSYSIPQFAEADSSPLQEKSTDPDTGRIIKRKPLSPGPSSSLLSESGPGSGSIEIAGAEASDEAAKLEVLKSRLERVRKEKERLSKLHELDELEKELQAEVMAASRKTMGGG
jgi:hypothetical protein